MQALGGQHMGLDQLVERCQRCLLYTSDAADERSRVALGGRRIIKKTKHFEFLGESVVVSQPVVDVSIYFRCAWDISRRITDSILI